MALDATTGSGGTQTTTQTPQSATSGGFTAGNNSSGVQPGTANNILSQSSGTGVPLAPTPLPTVDLSQASNGGQSQVTQPPAQHHFSPALFGISALFLVIAIALFWTTTRADKNTTE